MTRCLVAEAVMELPTAKLRTRHFALSSCLVQTIRIGWASVIHL